MDFAGATVVPLDGAGPEDVLVADDGTVYTGLADGRILRIADLGARIETVGTVPGRPLGLEFLGPDELLVCASDAGLVALPLAGGAVRTLTDAVAGRRLGAVNNASVADDGTIYFTDSSQRHAVPQWRRDLVERTATGRLLRRDPDGTVTELLGGLEFANGVTLSADGSFVAVAETGTGRVHRVQLTGPRAGRAGILSEGLSGYPDNISLGSDGLIWVALPAQRMALLSVVHRLPPAARGLVARVPDRLQPPPGPTVSVVAVDAGGRIVHEYRGSIPGLAMLTAVRERDGRLWFGSLTSSAVATLQR